MNKRFVFGWVLGIICGILAASSFYQATQKSIFLTISGKVSRDTASHEDSQLDNRTYLENPIVLRDRISLKSGVVDINDLSKLIGQSVKVSGQIEDPSLKNEDGDSILELSIKNIDVMLP